MKMGMITNLFESFDPIINFYLALNWLRIFFYFIFIFNCYWLIPSRIIIFWMIFLNLIYKEFKLLLINNKYQSNIFIFLSLFIYIILMNLFGLIPYVFTVTSHISFNLILALPVWFRFVVYGYFNKTMQIFIHLVPKNTPVFLINFMVLIEFIRNLIRPLTLSIRLTANLIAGHLLLILLRGFLSRIRVFIVLVFILLQNILLILEISMSFIQAYVFSTLRVLYFIEFK